MSYFRTVVYEIRATCAPEAEVEWAIHGPEVEEPNVRVLHVGEATPERPDHPLRKRMCPYDNPACPAPTALMGEGHHAACVEAETPERPAVS